MKRFRNQPLRIDEYANGTDVLLSDATSGIGRERASGSLPPVIY
jgi:hypothetical protein